MARKYEFWIGTRYVRSRSTNGFVSLISAISMLGIAVAVAVLIVVLSVVNGFERELQDRLLAMTAHASIEHADGRLQNWRDWVGQAEEHVEVAAAAPYVSGQGLLVLRDRLSGGQFIGIEPQLETRILSIPIDDTAEQTKQVLLKIAEDTDGADYRAWQSLQHLLETGNRRVVIPFAKEIAGLTLPAGVRIRRDFGTVLSLIKAHALLHQMSRETDNDDRIVATVRDYDIVWGLVDGLISGGVGLTIPKTVRETVDVVSGADTELTIKKVAAALELDPSATWRRVRKAIKLGYLQNLEERPRQPAKLILGDPMSEDTGVLPSAERLQQTLSPVQTPMQSVTR